MTLGVSEESLVWRQEVQLSSIIQALLHLSPSPAQIFPLKYERSYHWPSVFKPGKIICHFRSGTTTPNKANNNHKVPSGNCCKGLSFSFNERVFLPSSYSLFPSAYEETTLTPSSERPNTRIKATKKYHQVTTIHLMSQGLKN